MTLALVVLVVLAWALLVSGRPRRALLAIGGGAVGAAGLLGVLTVLVAFLAARSRNLVLRSAVVIATLVAVLVTVPATV